MSKLITDAFPKTKKEKPINQKLRQTKTVNSAKTIAQDDTAVEAIATKQKELAVLKDFDLNTEYGPCIGITREERWERAEKYGLQPPQEVREIILRYSDLDTTVTECIWYDSVI